VKKFSGGMKRRLNIVAAILHEPTLLVLDEPTVGVDPQSRRHIFDAIRALRDRGMTIVYTSHYMEEVEELCDRIAIMDAGKIVAQGTLAELAAKYDGGGTEIELDGSIDETAIKAALEAAGATIKRIGAKRHNLESVFLKLTGREMRDA
jgi:ABC-2 type transport system ATP-binding protein